MRLWQFGGMAGFGVKWPYGLAALLYGACVILAWRTPWPYAAKDRTFLAAADLPHNHRIRLKDLTLPSSFPADFGFYMPAIESIAGKYVTAQCLREGDKIGRKDVTFRPDLQIPNNKRAIAFTLPPEARFIGDMEPGTTLSLLGQDADTKSAIKVLATVHAMICENSDTAAEVCTPVLILDDGQIDMVTRNKAALRMALVSPPDHNPCQDAPK